MPFGGEYCSEECRSLYAARAKKETRKETAFFALAILAVAAVTAALYLLR
jgi:predicted nucleic acid-binding Zn ribbon protein